MQTCVKCGGQADLTFRALTVRTIHLREMKGERRVQGLGDFILLSACRACAQKRLDDIRKPGGALAKRLLPFVIIMLVGVVLAGMLTFGGTFLASLGLNTLAGDGVLRLFGLAMLLCGGMGVAGTVSSFLDTRKEYAPLSDEEALLRAAWAVASEGAPKKSGDEDLTYIPVTERTLAMKNGDLMIEYKLVPEIAREAYGLLHKPEE